VTSSRSEVIQDALTTIGQVARSAVERTTPAEAPDSAHAQVVHNAGLDLPAVAVSIAELLGIRPDPVAPSVVWLAPPEWAARALDLALPTLLPLVDLWFAESDDAVEARYRSADIGDVLGALVGNVVADVAQQSLGDFEMPLPKPHSRGVIALPTTSLAALARDWDLPLESVARWAQACSIVAQLIARREILGSRLSRLAIRYRLEVGRYEGGPFAAALSDFMASGTADIDRLMGSRTAAQLGIAARLAEICALVDALGILAWRSIDPDYTIDLESRLTESLRRRRSGLSRHQMVAEFWLGVPIGPTLDPELDRIVSAAPLVSGELARLLATVGSAPSLSANLRSAGDSPTGRRRVVSLCPMDDRGPDQSAALSSLETRLRAALATISRPEAADVVRGRIDGLHTDFATRTAEQAPNDGGYRTGVVTSWLQSYLARHEVDLDKQVEAISALYAYVIASEKSAPLLASRADQDLLRLHTRAVIFTERKQGSLGSAVEMALFCWLVSLTRTDLTPELLANWQQTRSQRLRMS
jgi:hypothetical protein